MGSTVPAKAASTWLPQCHRPHCMAWQRSAAQRIASHLPRGASRCLAVAGLCFVHTFAACGHYPHPTWGLIIPLRVPLSCMAIKMPICGRMKKDLGTSASEKYKDLHPLSVVHALSPLAFTPTPRSLSSPTGHPFIPDPTQPGCHHFTTWNLDPE